MGARHRARRSRFRRPAVAPHRPRRRDLRRRAQRDDRGSGRHSGHPRPPRAPGLVAVPAQARMAERRGGACVLGRRSGFLTRSAIRGRLGGRTRQVETCGGDLGHAAIRPSPRFASAPDGDDDAAADPAAEALPRRSAGRGLAGAHRRQCGEPGAGLPRHGRRAAMPARGSGGRNSTATSSRIVPMRSGRAT